MKKLTLTIIAGLISLGLLAQNPNIEKSKDIILGGGTKSEPTPEQQRSIDNARDVLFGKKEQTPDRPWGIFDNKEERDIFEKEQREVDNLGLEKNHGQRVKDINLYYHARAREIRQNPLLTDAEKKRRLSALNKERVARIHSVIGKKKYAGLAKTNKGWDDHWDNKNLKPKEGENKVKVKEDKTKVKTDKGKSKSKNR